MLIATYENAAAKVANRQLFETVEAAASWMRTQIDTHTPERARALLHTMLGNTPRVPWGSYSSDETVTIREATPEQAIEFTAPAELAHAERAHATLGASGCYRWWNCPGSVRLSAGRVSASSVYAAEGTAAHELAQLCLEQGQPVEAFIDRTVAGFLVDDDMASAVQVYVDECTRISTKPGVETMIEARFNLEAYEPPAAMFGTADFVAYDRPAQTLYVYDLKFGKGVQVAAAGNPQLMYYALGALAVLGEGKPVSRVVAAIVQPRAAGEPVRSTEIDAFDLVEWSIELMDRARATQAPDAPLAAGTWCKFCPAAGQCPEQARAALEVAQLEFAEVVAFKEPEVSLMLPFVDALSPQQLGWILDRADELDDWLRDVRNAASALITKGTDVPGWKMVAKRGQRNWQDPENAAVSLMMDGAPEAEVFETAIRSPAQLEKLLAERLKAEAGGTKKAATEKAKAIVAAHTVTVSSGPTLAPETDARPALPGGGAEFTTLPAPSNQEEQ